MRHRSEKNGRVRDRIKAVLLADKGWSYKQIAEALLLDAEKIGLHIKDYQREKKLTIASGGSDSKLTPFQTQHLCKHLEQNVYLTADPIRHYIREQYGACYRLSGITAWLKQHGFTYKKRVLQSAAYQRAYYTLDNFFITLCLLEHYTPY